MASLIAAQRCMPSSQQPWQRRQLELRVMQHPMSPASEKCRQHRFVEDRHGYNFIGVCLHLHKKVPVEFGTEIYICLPNASNCTHNTGSTCIKTQHECTLVWLAELHTVVQLLATGTGLESLLIYFAGAPFQTTCIHRATKHIQRLLFCGSCPDTPVVWQQHLHCSHAALLWHAWHRSYCEQSSNVLLTSYLLQQALQASEASLGL